MQKRVLSFLMVLAMVFSLLPVSMVSAETATADYALIIQKAHNQTEGSLAIDIYLKDNTDTKAAVTGYQFKVNPAEGLVVTGAADATGNNGLAGSNNVFIYTPGSAELKVGESRKLVATVTVTGETLPAQVADAITLSDVTVTTAEAQFPPAVETVAYGCDHECAHGEGKWTALTNEVVKSYYVKTVNGNSTTESYDLPAGNYYLVEDIAVAKMLRTVAGATVNLCMNGYTLKGTANTALINVEDGVLNIDDCTATGSAIDGTLEGGTIIANNKSYGGGIRASTKATVNVCDVTIDANKVVAKDCGYVLYTLKGGTINAENIQILGGATDPEAKSNGNPIPANLIEFRGDINLKSVLIKGVKAEGQEIISANHAAVSGNLVLEDVVITGSQTNDPAMYLVEADYDTVTLKGNCQFDTPVYLKKGAKVNLELGSNARVAIQSEQEKTAETFGELVVIPEGATLTAGTVLYKNNGMHVDYKNGVFSFSGHAHDDVSFLAWDDSDSLPIEGNWYLTTDVTLNCNRFEIAYRKTLNLDLNGHTIRQTKAGAGIYAIKGKLNLYDCAEEYDAEGNWIGGQITGGDQEYGGAIGIQRGETGAAEEYRPTFNMYGGRLAGNGNGKTSSGGAIYMASSQTTSAGKLIWGGLFNMYGGEIYDNTATILGTAVTVWGFSPTATSGTKGADPALGMGATFNMYGGKIHGNNGTREDKTFIDGTINLTYDAVFNMYGGEICNNHVERGGAIYLDKAATTVNITGGKIYGNSAVENAAKRTVVTSSKKSDGTTTYTTYAGRGGAIFTNNGGKVTIENAEIYDNYSTKGGAMTIYGGSATNVTVKNTLFKGNYSVDKRTNDEAAASSKAAGNYQEWGNGGAIFFLDKNTTTQFINCTFENNRATKDNTKDNDYNGAGGAIYADTIQKLTIDGCTFTGNECEKESGGALYLRNGAIADVKNSTFTGNSCKVAGSAIYTLGASVLKLTDTVVTDNTVKNNALGAVYITSTSGRLVLSGKVVITKNTNNKTASGGNNQADLLFQTNNTIEIKDADGNKVYEKNADGSIKQSSGKNVVAKKTDIRPHMIEVNELGEGSHINAYCGIHRLDYQGTAYVTENVAAAKAVEVTANGAQTDWDCGWITVYHSTSGEGKNVSYVDLTEDGADNKEFTYGHYHKDAEGNYYELAAWTDGAKLPSALSNGKGYYLTKDVKIAEKAGKAENDIKTHNASGLDYHLCLNGHTIEQTANISSSMFFLRSSNTLIEDCTTAYDNDGHWLDGGVIKNGYRGANGGALYLNDNNNIGATYTISGIKFENCYETDTRIGTESSAYSGGAIHARNNGSTVDNTDVIIEGCYFEKCHNKMDGGAVAGLNGVDFTITDTVFEDCYSGRYGGALMLHGATKARAEVLIDNCKFGGNYTTSNAVKQTDDTATTADETVQAANQTGLGGAIYATAADVTITDSKFIGNYVKNNEKLTDLSLVTDKNGTDSIDRGGAIYLSGNAVLDMDDCYLEGNETDYHGGAIFFNGSTGNTIDKTTFVGNNAKKYGGAIATTGTTGLTLNNNTFEANNATNGGGAIMAYRGTFTMSGNTFEKNTSKTGGAIHTNPYDNSSYTVNMTINGDTFKENAATGSSGAIHCFRYTTLTVNGANFAGNTAASGGVLYSAASASSLKFDNCVFTGNKATNGGVMYLEWYAATSYVKGCTFTGNEATERGGALYIKGGTNGKFTIGGAGDEGCTFTGNKAKDAAAILTTSSVKTAATDTTPAIYYNPTVHITNSSFTENVASNQTSVVLVWVGASAILTDTVIQNNTSKIYGAVHISHSQYGGNITLAGDTVITDNVSTSYTAYAENSDLYVHTYNSNHEIDAYIDVSGLTDGAKVGVNFNPGRDENPIFTKNGGAEKKDYFYCNSTRYILTEIDGELALVKYVDEEGNAYTTVQAAINAAEAAGETTFKLQAATTEKLTVNTIDTIDLNGKDGGTVTMPEGVALTLIDSATNSYTNENVAEIKVIGDVKGYAEVGSGNSVKRYVTIASEADATTGAKTVTAHRVYLAINSKTLRPFNNGVGFKAIFAADEVVASQVTYGVELSGYETFKDADGNAAIWKASFDEMEPGAQTNIPNQKTIVIYDAISAADTSRWNANMYGRPFITINGETYYGKTVDVNMKAMAAEALASGDAAVIAAVNEMMTKCGVSAN